MLSDMLIVGFAFGATTVALYGALIYADEHLHKNRLFSTSVAGVATASCMAGAIAHYVSSSAYKGVIPWAHCKVIAKK